MKCAYCEKEIGEVGLKHPAFPNSLFHVACALNMAMEIMKSGLLIAGEYEAEVRTATSEEKLNEPKIRPSECDSR